jgi:hypothetical protein
MHSSFLLASASVSTASSAEEEQEQDEGEARVGSLSCQAAAVAEFPATCIDAFGLLCWMQTFNH